MAKIRNRKSGNKVSCFFTPVLLFPGFTAGENTAAKLAKVKPCKPGEKERAEPMDISSLTPDKQVKYQYWLNVIHECRASGLTNQDWCEQNGISIKSYYYWIAKFRKLALEDLPRKEYVSSVPVLATQGILESKSSSFVEIHPVSSERTENSKPAAVLKTGNISIELYNDASESFLSMLIGVAQKC